MKAGKVFAIAASAVSLNCAAYSHGYEYDQEATMKIMMEMVGDLGGHDAVGKNSGKTMRCGYGGTREVSIVSRKSVTTYTGAYNNCREKDSTRDGLYEIVLDGAELVSSSSKRSINGELIDVALQGDGSGVRKLIKAKADVNYTESIQNTEGGYIDEWTPLMSAVMAGSLDTVTELVSAGAWVNHLNSLEVNALWIAANTGNLEIVRNLAEHGAYINKRSREGVTPLMAAAMNGHLDVVRFLIAAKAGLDNVHKDGDSALMFALASGHTAIARLLIEAGANVDIKNRFETTALHIAVAEGNLEVTKLLIEPKANLTARTSSGKTALDVARAKGHGAIAQMLEKAAQ